MSVSVTIRAAKPADIPAITEIYAHHVRTGTGSFETAPPSADEMLSRMITVISRPAPYLVAVDATGRVLGYAYAGHFRTREAFDGTVEDSIYVHPEAQRQGIGRKLLEALIEASRAAGFMQMVSVIGDSANAGSIGLHRALGFQDIGVMHRCGVKFGRLLDCVMMELELNPYTPKDPE